MIDLSPLSVGPVRRCAPLTTAGVAGRGGLGWASVLGWADGLRVSMRTPPDQDYATRSAAGDGEIMSFSGNRLASIPCVLASQPIGGSAAAATRVERGHRNSNLCRAAADGGGPTAPKAKGSSGAGASTGRVSSTWPCASRCRRRQVPLRNLACARSRPRRRQEARLRWLGGRALGSAAALAARRCYHAGRNASVEERLAMARPARDRSH